MISKTVVMAALVMLSSSPAWAHPGLHAFSDYASAVVHLVSEPDHIAMFTALVIAVFFIRWLLTSEKGSELVERLRRTRRD